MEGCSEVLGATLEAGEEGVKGLRDSATAVTSYGSSCCARASKSTRRSGADSVPRISSGSRSRYLVWFVGPKQRSVPRDPGHRGW